jgi:hypothetical protein
MEKFDITPTEAIGIALIFLAYLIIPILAIWSFNTLFETGITLTFKHWLAGFVLIMIARFVFRGTHRIENVPVQDPFYDDDHMGERDFYDDDMQGDDFYDDDYPPYDSGKPGRKAKLIVHPAHKDKFKFPPDEQ